VIESRYDRLINVTPAALWDQYEVQQLGVRRAIESVLNVIRWTIAPRRVGATADAVLASMPARLKMLPGEVAFVDLNFRDEDQEQAIVGGADLVTPVASTDFTMTANEDGSGLVMTAFAAVSLADKDKGGTSVRVRVENSHGDLPGYFLTAVRGRKITKFDEMGDEERDDASVRVYDARPLSIQFAYLARVSGARDITRNLLALRKAPFMAPRMVVRRSVDAEIEADILDRDCGDLVTIRESVAGLDGTQRTFADGVTLTAGADATLVAEYMTTRGAVARPFWLAEVPGFSEAGVTTYGG
jgi:hypothetical protein